VIDAGATRIQRGTTEGAARRTDAERVREAIG